MMYVHVSLCVNMVACMTRHSNRDQRMISAVCPHLPPCLSQDFLFTAHTPHSQEFSCLCLLSSCRSAGIAEACYRVRFYVNSGESKHTFFNSYRKHSTHCQLWSPWVYIPMRIQGFPLTLENCFVKCHFIIMTNMNKKVIIDLQSKSCDFSIRS